MFSTSKLARILQIFWALFIIIVPVFIGIKLSMLIDSSTAGPSTPLAILILFGVLFGILGELISFLMIWGLINLFRWVAEKDLLDGEDMLAPVVTLPLWMYNNGYIKNKTWYFIRTSKKNRKNK